LGDIFRLRSFVLERTAASPDLCFVGFFLRQRNIPLWRQPACANLLWFGEIGEFSRPSGKGEVWPFFDLSIAVIFSVPSSDLAGRREPDLAVTLSVSDKLAEEMRAERSPVDKRVIPSDHELGIRLTLFVETIEAVLPHLQEIFRCSPRSLITG